MGDMKLNDKNTMLKIALFSKLAELTQYVAENAPLIKAQREGENVATRRNIRGREGKVSQSS